jgi:von Willebrand factor type A domain
MKEKFRVKATIVCALALAAFAVAGSWTPVFAQSLSPSSVSLTLKPGDSATVAKTVHTPIIPPHPDICFLADTTGSMFGAISNVQANAAAIMASVRASQPDAQFCAAEYKDKFECPSDPFAFRLDQQITGNTADVQSGIGLWSASGGCDTPEQAIFALHSLATGATGFRTGSSRVIVWFGDAPSHEDGGVSEAQAIAELNAANIRVIAINVGNLDAFGQASAIAAGTGGLLTVSDPGSVTSAILAGLHNLPATVEMASNCATQTVGAIGTSFAPPSVTVPSGGDATFAETISASLGASQGSVYHCDDHAVINGATMTDPASGLPVLESKAITIIDVTAPSAACLQGTNPSGKNIPGAKGNGGQNPDGFYQLIASDNVGIASIVVCDGGSSFCSNPFGSGDQVKITQAPGATPRDERPGPGVIASHLTLNGDAVMKVTDTTGNVSTVACLVPPPPK